jgi:N-methylhydantoinase A
VEVMSYAVVVTTVPEEVENLLAPSEVFAPEVAAAETRLVRDTITGEASPWTIIDRTALAPGASIDGPAIISEDETSTLISPGWRATMNGLGYIELVRQ